MQIKVELNIPQVLHHGGTDYSVSPGMLRNTCITYAFYFSKIYTHDLTFSKNEVENVEDV